MNVLLVISANIIIKMNFFDEYNWDKILNLYPENKWDLDRYYKILCPQYPVFLDKYIKLPLLQRLKGIGLLCGTDWTPLYKNRFFYSRLDHSIGVALIIWNFTHDKAQTISGLLHDVSTPVFSHVSDFRKGDALTQTATESANIKLIKNNKDLIGLLEEDSLSVEQVCDYHIYPIADNEIPCLSADRLEYMFPSGAALEGSWSLDEIEETYKDISVLMLQKGQVELGFNTLEIAEKYCKKFCMTGHVLQLNENKLTLQLLGTIMNLAVENNILTEDDFMQLSEKELLEKFENKIVTMGTGLAFSSQNSLSYLNCLYKTFRSMDKIEHCQFSLSPSSHFSVSLSVKQRYINPLVKHNGKIYRLSEVSEKSAELINDFLNYSDTEFGCVKLWK